MANLFKNNRFNIFEFDDQSFGLTGVLDTDNLQEDDVVTITFKNGQSITVPIDMVWIGYRRFNNLQNKNVVGNMIGQGRWNRVRCAQANQPVCLVLRKGYLRQADGITTQQFSPNNIQTITPTSKNMEDMIFYVMKKRLGNINNNEA